MNHLRPVSRFTLSEQVATQIVSAISTGRWKPGDRLPSESELCLALHIGRLTLREALKSLAFVGVVHMRAGDGTYVADGPSKFLDRVFTHGLLNTEKDVDDLWETRMVLETELAALCAERATDSDRADLHRLIGQMKEVTGPGREEQFLALDLQFHLSIAAYSKNQVLAQLLRTIRELLRELIMKSLQVPGNLELAYAEHLAILEALEQRNPSNARKAMRHHLRTFQQQYKILHQALHPKGDSPEGPLPGADLSV